MKENTISLCMIVRNEEDMLEKCLQSVQGIVDEIIVVDTGSTDQTKAIAKRYGAQVHDYTWQADFAAARNFALEQATSKWILQLDADEFIHASSKGRIQACLDTSKAHAFRVQILNYDDVASTYHIHQYPRIFKNLPSIRYQGRIHEQLMDSMEQLSHEETDIQVIHLGYTQEVVKKKNKGKRNIRILQEELKERPEDPFIHYNLGNEMMKAKAYKKAMKHYQYALQHSKNITVQSSSVLQLIRALTQTNRTQEALQLVLEAEGSYPDFTDLFYIKGEILEGLGRESEAKECYLKCLSLGEAPRKYFTTAGIGRIYPLEQLTQFAIESRDFQTALGYLSEVNEHYKYGVTHAVRMVGILLQLFDAKQVVAFLLETYPTNGEKDQYMKAYLAHHYRLYTYFAPSYDLALAGLPEKERQIIAFYRGMDTPLSKELALTFSAKSDMRVYAFVYYLLKNEQAVRDALLLDGTSCYLLHHLEGTPMTKQPPLQTSFFIRLLQELMLIGKYDLVEALLPLAGAFETGVYVEIGDLFYHYQQDDLAIEYYTKHLAMKQDASLYTKTASLLYHQGMYHEALLFAEKANKLNPHHFKSIEIMLESCRHLNEQPLERQLIEHFLQSYPESTYLLSKKEA